MRKYQHTGRNTGITLLELLMVVILSALVFTALMNMLIHSQRVEATADARTNLVLFCQEEMADLKVRPFDELEPGEHKISRESKHPMEGVVRITDLQPGKLKKIEIECSVELPRGNRTYVLATLRSK